VPRMKTLAPLPFLLIACGSAPSPESVRSTPSSAAAAAPRATAKPEKPTTATVEQSKPAPSPRRAGLGPLIPDDAYMGCACGVSSGDEADDVVFVGPMGEDLAWINLDGQNRTLPRKGTESQPDGLKRAPDVYAADGLTLTISWSNGQMCDPEEECETVTYDAVLQLERPGEAPIVVRGPGWCGC
jgi:hypothetical protein